jgi:hypothetical protein
MILGKWPTWSIILYYVFIFVFNSVLLETCRELKIKTIIAIVILVLPESQAGELWEPLNKFCFGFGEHWIEVLSDCFISSLKGIMSQVLNHRPLTPAARLRDLGLRSIDGRPWTVFLRTLFSHATIIPPVLFTHFYLETCSLTERQTGEAWESSSKSEPFSETGERWER